MTRLPNTPDDRVDDGLRGPQDCSSATLERLRELLDAVRYSDFPQDADRAVEEIVGMFVPSTIEPSADAENTAANLRTPQSAIKSRPIILPLTKEQAEALEKALQLASIHCEEPDLKAINQLHHKLAAAKVAAI